VIELHEGSKWDGDDVVDLAGDRIRIGFAISPILVAPQNAFVKDALAVIRKAKLDPLAEAAMELLEALENCDYGCETGGSEVRMSAMKLENLLP
jgi:hypothetical protein